MNTTDDLIRHLVEHDGRTGRLPPPWQRAVAWLTISLTYVVLIVMAMEPRADLGQKVFDGRFLIEEIATFITALFAAFAAFCVKVPGSSRKLVLCLHCRLQSSLGASAKDAWRIGSNWGQTAYL